jgi:hypothetical protein
MPRTHAWHWDFFGRRSTPRSTLSPNARKIKDTSAEGGRYHNKRFVALAVELGLRGPERPANVIGWSDCQITDGARLPYLPDDQIITGGGTTEGEQDGEDGEDQDEDKPEKRGGRRVAVQCACQPKPRKLHLTPKQLEDGPVICGLCSAPFAAPGEDQDHNEEN